MEIDKSISHEHHRIWVPDRYIDCYLREDDGMYHMWAVDENSVEINTMSMTVESTKPYNDTRIEALIEYAEYIADLVSVDDDEK
jgi:hypothetical protein